MPDNHGLLFTEGVEHTDHIADEVENKV